MDGVEVKLKLKRLHTALDLYDFDVHRDIPEHSAAAGVSLFLSDVLSLQARMDEDGAEQAVEKLQELVLSPKVVMLSKLSGGVGCTLRAAAFAVMLQFLPVPSSSPTDWVARHDLKGNPSDAPWRLSDTLYALESLVCHWESLCADMWIQPDALFNFSSPDAPLSRYLTYLWAQCRRFVCMANAAELSRYMDASSFTMPYAVTHADTGAMSHELSLSPTTVSIMCELWRHIENERRAPFASTLLLALPGAHDTFLRVFEFEKNQLSVDKFREELRRRLAERHLMLGDAEIWRAKQNGKDPELDLVVGARMPLAMPGFLQTAASAWTFERMQQHPTVRDELYRLMVDSAFRAKGIDFSLRFFRSAGVPPETAPRLNAHLVARLAHGFVVLRTRGTHSTSETVLTPPLPFAKAFSVWARETAQSSNANHTVPEVLSLLEKFL
jgi:hypothetical protein